MPWKCCDTLQVQKKMGLSIQQYGINIFQMKIKEFLGLLPMDVKCAGKGESIVMPVLN
jgi:hypothetical protein